MAYRVIYSVNTSAPMFEAACLRLTEGLYPYPLHQYGNGPALFRINRSNRGYYSIMYRIEFVISQI